MPPEGVEICPEAGGKITTNHGGKQESRGPRKHLSLKESTKHK